MTVVYVSGPPTVEYGETGNVLLHFPVNADDTITLSFKSDEHYQSAMEVADRAYLFASTAKSQRLYPSLWGEAS